MLEFLIFALIFTGVATFFITQTIKMVPQSEEHIVERFGKYDRTLKPGFNTILPVIERVTNKVSVLEKVINVPPQNVITKDNAMLQVDAVVFYEIHNPAKAIYRVEDVTVALKSLSITKIRNSVGSMEMDDLLSSRKEVSEDLLKTLDDATDPWGVKVLRVEIEEVKPPDQLIQSMSRQMIAERDKRAAVLDAEGRRQAEILNAEGIKQAIVLKAEGEKEAAFRKAEAREREAEAEAKATMMLSQAINKGNVQAVNYFMAQKYIEALGQLASAENQKVLMIPLEAASVIGSLAGLSEIAKEAMSTDAFHAKSGNEKKVTPSSSVSVDDGVLDMNNVNSEQVLTSNTIGDGDTSNDSKDN